MDITAAPTTLIGRLGTWLRAVPSEVIISALLVSVDRRQECGIGDGQTGLCETKQTSPPYFPTRLLLGPGPRVPRLHVLDTFSLGRVPVKGHSLLLH